MDFQVLLRDAGPYTAPLCGAMGWAIRWLLSDRKRLLSALSESSDRERKSASNRTVEALESARLLADSTQAQRESLHNHDRLLDRVIERWDRWLSSKE